MKIKIKKSLFWCHYEFISGRYDHHQILYERKFLLGVFILVPARTGFEKKFN